jgi:pimeloyl-ACP methyl ester carboxylesterase
MQVFRTPEERFEGLPDFAYEPHYRTVGELRLAHLDVGEGAPVLMLHVEPTWSFIWRKVIPAVRDAGYRCVVPDHAGFGRSDKPTDPAWHSLGRHVKLASSLLEELDLRDVTVVCHDWGGPIGLTVALAHPDRIARAVMLDTVIDPREAWTSELWVRFREFVERTEDLPMGELVAGSCLHGLADDVLAAYDAPFPVPARVKGRCEGAADERAAERRQGCLRGCGCVPRCPRPRREADADAVGCMPPHPRPRGRPAARGTDRPPHRPRDPGRWTRSPRGPGPDGR